MTAIQDVRQAPAAIGVRPVAGHIGADVTGLDISRPLAPEQVAAIRNALHRYKVVFFRGQDLIEHLDLPRTLHRVTLVGDVPVGPDGGESELVAGRSFTSKHTVVVAD